MTDEQCIAMALLHGCEFYHDWATTRWYVAERSTDTNGWFFIHRTNDEKTGWNGFETRELLARAYCEYYNLLQEVTDELR